MKIIQLLIFLLFSIAASSQHIGGLYTGKLINDSTGKVQQYELALSEYRGQITGYAYTTFIVADTFYYSVKRIKAVRNNGTLQVEDVKMLAHNFPQPPDRGVRQIMNIPLGTADSITSLNGAWRTTQTKKFYAISGGLHLAREKDSSASALLAHLYDLGEVKRTSSSQAVVASKFIEKAKNNTQSLPDTSRATGPLSYTQRSIQLLQTFSIVSNSVVLSFYDNGIVDGDIISVYLNEENIIAHTKLTAVAAKKTIILHRGLEAYRLVLAAENLGTIPPNTGLLVIQDGSNRYQINFTADLQTNAAIEFRRTTEKTESPKSR